jgi:DNA (cytosine-5)-methyltransferase 1
MHAGLSRQVFPEFRGQNKVMKVLPRHSFPVFPAPDRVGKQSSTESVKQHHVISLFSGCGGMDLGFAGDFRFGGRYYEKLPFDIVWANDINDAACATYKLNLRHAIHAGDIRGSINTLPKRADVVIGGFPCQDVSINGALRLGEGKQTVLYCQMIEIIKRTRPKAFVAENVRGLLMSNSKDFFDRMMVDFKATGYRLSSQLYLAADYGVPQMRERVFIIGVKGRRTFKHPVPLVERMTAYDALYDLENIKERQVNAHTWSRAAKSPEQGSRKLKSDRPATTIRAEHHGNIQWHYRLDRRISLREAARLQSFPDDFEFHKPMRETERMIGNAVPPVLAWHIATALRDHLGT